MDPKRKGYMQEMDEVGGTWIEVGFIIRLSRTKNSTKALIHGLLVSVFPLYWMML